MVASSSGSLVSLVVVSALETIDVDGVSIGDTLLGNLDLDVVGVCLDVIKYGFAGAGSDGGGSSGGVIISAFLGIFSCFVIGSYIFSNTRLSANCLCLKILNFLRTASVASISSRCNLSSEFDILFFNRYRCVQFVVQQSSDIFNDVI